MEFNSKITILKKRAEIIAAIRQFFLARDMLEVDTPLLYPSAILDPYIESFRIDDHYLQTSPEFAMKRLLAAGSGSIYQICKAFRKEEIGRHHRCEFTLLEWYHVGFDHHQLMSEMDDLLQGILKTEPAERVTYQVLFEKHLKVNPHLATIDELKSLSVEKEIHTSELETKDDWLNLLLSHCIEPLIGKEKPMFVYDYPKTQAALAKLSNDALPIAQRFEVYYQGLELANGFNELTDSAQQRERFTADQATRKARGLPIPPLDEAFLKALKYMPDCAGVALGIDRLVMLALGSDDISVLDL